MYSSYQSNFLTEGKQNFTYFKTFINENMISREDAIKKLKEYWGTNQLVFEAEFHIPKNILRREGSKLFGYFRNIRFKGEFIEYPVDTIATNERRVSVYQVLKNNLKDQDQYEVTLDLAKDEYRKKNPFQLIVKQYKKLENKPSPVETTLHKTITDIFNENININSPFPALNLANSVESFATDIYSEDKRFIYELIQNADDAALDEESEISIQILNNYVIISHNGAPFNSRDIRGLCSIGLGTKINDANKTGYKGIGFKSVFGQPDGLVFVKSEHTLFKFDREYSSKKGWNNKWGNKQEWEERNGVTFNCPWQMMPLLINNVDDSELDKVLNNENYTVKTAIKILNGEMVFENIIRFFGDAKFLLFLRRITLVEITFNNQCLAFNKQKIQDNKEIVSLYRNYELLSNWYVRNWIHNIPQEIQKELKSDPKTPKKIQSMEKTEISFALQINDTFDEIKLLKEGESALYSYLPTTETKYNIPFIVNCNFLLDPSREKIDKKRKWNKWLFHAIGFNLVESCSEFMALNLFETTYLSILRNGFYPETDNLDENFNSGLLTGLKHFAILKNKNNQPCKLYEVALDEFNLYQVEPDLVNKLSSFLNETEENLFLDANHIIEINDSITPVLKLNPFVLTESNLKAFFSSDYAGQVINTASNYKILSFLCSLESKDPGGSWFTVITKNPLIINQYGHLDFIKRVCFPMELDEIYDNEISNILINNDVYQLINNDEELMSWLMKLGVTDPGRIPYLEKEIIGNIQNAINDTNYLQITKFIVKLHNEKKLTDVHYLNLQEFSLKTDKGFIEANRCSLSASYNPSIDFRTILPEQAILSDNYLEIGTSQECRTFFKMLGAIDDIEFTKKIKINSPDLLTAFVDSSYSTAKEGHSYPSLIGIFHPNTPITHVPFYLQTFTFFEQTLNFEFSKVFWNRLFARYTPLKDRTAKSSNNFGKPRDYTIYRIGGGHEISTIDMMGWGYYPNNSVSIPSYIFWFIQNNRCIPTNKGLKLAVETYSNSKIINDLAGDFLPIISTDKVVPEEWNKILKLITSLSIDDLFTVLNCISDLVNNRGFLDKENEKRLGLLYNELMDRLDIDYTNVYQRLSNWAITGKLVGSTKKCFKACDLLHINSSGFENKNTNISTILLPKNVKTNSTHFLDLLEAFGIKIIDRFSFDADILFEIYDLKIKLLKLIGPVCLILKNKMIVNNMDKSMYDRFINISKTQFIFCKNIHPIFIKENEVIRGEFVNFYYDKMENKFRLSIDWKNPLTILEISYEISSLMLAVSLEKEIMMLLRMPLVQIEQYLNSQKLDLEEYQNLPIYKEIMNEIKHIEEIVNINQINKPEHTQAESSIGKITEIYFDGENHDTNALLTPEQKNIEVIIDPDNVIKDFFWKNLAESDIIFIRGIIEGVYEINDQMEANLAAKIKTLLKIRSEYSEVEITDEEYHLKAGNDKIIIRSAQKGLLYLDLFNWNRLCENNVKLAVYTNNEIHIFQTQSELFDFIKKQNKFGVLKLPNDYTLDYYNSLDNITDKGKWHYVFIVNENTQAAKSYKEVMAYSDPDLFKEDNF